ncbi:MAG: hypothetical protein ACI4JB_06690 [Porcipelethomonas sp.]
MAKFKVGDRVKCVRIVDDNKRVVGKIGTIVSIDIDDNRYAVVFDENVGGHSFEGLCEHYHGWWCGESCLVKVDDCNEKIVITSDGKTTTAKMYNGKKFVKAAKAICSPEDEFNIVTGAAIAFSRLFDADVNFVDDEPEEKPLLNTKFCVYEGDGIFKTGHIYEVVDGKIIRPDGDRLPYGFSLHTTEELYDYFEGLKIVEVVDE